MADFQHNTNLSRRQALQNAISVTLAGAAVSAGIAAVVSPFKIAATQYDVTWRTARPGKSDDNYGIRLEAEHDRLLSLPLQSNDDAATLLRLIRDEALRDDGDAVAFKILIQFLSA